MNSRQYLVMLTLIIIVAIMFHSEDEPKESGFTVLQETTVYVTKDGGTGVLTLQQGTVIHVTFEMNVDEPRQLALRGITP